MLASTKKGSKPDFHGAAGGEKAKELYDYFFTKVQDLYEPEKVKNGVFQAMMEVSLVNDGPVGVDYRCEDGAVIFYQCSFSIFSSYNMTDIRCYSLGNTGNRDKSTKDSGEIKGQ